MRESPPSGRSEPRDIVELRRLRQEQPDLASAVDLQIELLQLQRRVQSRVTLPSIRLDVEYLNARLAQGPILDFEQIPVDWSDLRFLLRATATAMRTHDALDEADVKRVDSLARYAARLEVVMRSWYESARPGVVAEPEVAGLDNVLLQAMHFVGLGPRHDPAAHRELTERRVGRGHQRERLVEIGRRDESFVHEELPEQAHLRHGRRRAVGRGFDGG